MIDTHCHLTHRKFADDRDEVIARMGAAGLDCCITIGTGVADAHEALALSRTHPGLVHCTAGLDPFSAHSAESFDDELARLGELVAGGGFCAVGEVGLDYHYDLEPHPVQARQLARQLELAVELGLPVVIHVREAHEDMAGVLAAHPDASGVIHSFTAGPTEAERYLKLGWHLAFNGVLTFKNAEEVRAAARLVPADRLLVETDSPYLAPVPKRGRRCEPAYVAHTLRFLSEVRGEDAAWLDEVTTRTARTTAAATGLAAGLAVLVALLSVGAVTAPLTRLRTAMSAVAGGSFTPPRDLPYARTDEIGDLTRSFRSMAERLAELDRLKAEFVSIASHELKTPVNVVRGYVEMLEDESYGEIDGRQREMFERIREQTDVLRERVDQLLALSRLEAQGMEVQLEPVTVSDLLEDLRRNFAGMAAQKRIVFGVTTEHTTPNAAMLDPRRVRDELLGNLLGNAFKFTPRGGNIDVRARGEAGWLVIEIRDSGEGIPAAELPYIFEKYYQAGHHAGRVGAGLGLAIAREIVEAHGGMISVESQRGVGSTFRVELPAARQGSNTINAAARFRPSLDEEDEATVGRRA